jgi:transposase
MDVKPKDEVVTSSTPIIYGGTLQDDESEPIEVRRGYSREHRPELKTDLCCALDRGAPLFLEVASGNQSECRWQVFEQRQQFVSLMQNFDAQSDVNPLFVIDAAFYHEPSVQRVGSLRWLSRVPLTLSDAQSLIHQNTAELEAVQCSLKDYKLWEIWSTYAGIEQRWILVESQTRKTQASIWEKELKRIKTAPKRRSKTLQKQVFACRPDALEAFLQFQETLEHHQVSEVAFETTAVKRAPDENKSAKRAEAIEGYQLKFSWQRKPEAEQKIREQLSRFILATNQLNTTDEYPAQWLLTEYKQQLTVERGFCFFKDPLFFTSNVLSKRLNGWWRWLS